MSFNQDFTTGKARATQQPCPRLRLEASPSSTPVSRPDSSIIEAVEASPASDLRRVSRAKADQLRTLLIRAEALPLADQRLLAAVFDRGMTVKDLAAAANAATTNANATNANATSAALRTSATPATSATSETACASVTTSRADPAESLARALRRRIRRLVARLTQPKFAFVLAHDHHWPSKRRAVARACIVLGLSQRQAAAELALTLHDIRREMNAIHALFAERARP